MDIETTTDANSNAMSVGMGIGFGTFIGLIIVLCFVWRCCCGKLCCGEPSKPSDSKNKITYRMRQKTSAKVSPHSERSIQTPKVKQPDPFEKF